MTTKRTGCVEGVAVGVRLVLSWHPMMAVATISDADRALTMMGR